MMMGTLPPPPNRWAMPFYYPNFQNDMWRIYGLVFFDDPGHFLAPRKRRFDSDRIRNCLAHNGIALCSTIAKAQRSKGNASDKFLHVVEAVALQEILDKLPHCRHIVTTGGLATQTLLGLHPSPPRLPRTNEHLPFSYGGRELTLTRLASSSRAYPLALAQKAEAYRRFFRYADILP